MQVFVVMAFVGGSYKSINKLFDNIEHEQWHYASDDNEESIEKSTCG